MLNVFLSLILRWSNYFPQKRSFLRAVSLTFGLYTALGRKTISRTISTRGLDQQDWSGDYKLFNRSKWDCEELFTPMIEESLRLLKEEALIPIAYDDTLLKKTGKKILDTSWQRDPLGPPFNTNFIWGTRYLQASILLPLYNDGKTPPRSIPVQFKNLPRIKRPKKNEGIDKWKEYRELKKKYNASTCFVEQVKLMRKTMDNFLSKDKRILVVVDGSYINRTCFNHNVDSTNLIGRAKKNSRLHHKNQEGGNRFYEKDGFTLEELRKNDSIPYQKTQIYYGNSWRKVRYKEDKEVYWKRATKRKPLRAIVIAPTPYKLRKKGKTYYRNPAYLLTDDFHTEAEVLIQKYFDRWQIEVNFQEEKGLIGLGQQQVWSQKAVHRVPVFVVSCYSALMLSSVLAFRDQREEQIFHILPKWRHKTSLRPSCLDIITLLRKEIIQNSKEIEFLGIKTNIRNIVFRSAA